MEDRYWEDFETTMTDAIDKLEALRDELRESISKDEE